MDVDMINITLNGEPFELGGSEDIPALISQMGADGKRVAIMLNSAVVSRSDWDQTSLAEGDNVEVLVFAGGG
jgi:sulfur carrier protein